MQLQEYYVSNKTNGINMKVSILLILHDRVVVIRSSLVQSVNLVEVVLHACRDDRKYSCKITHIYSFKVKGKYLNFSSTNMSSMGV